MEYSVCFYYIYIYNFFYGLLRWLTGCVSTNPTMSAYEWKVQKSSSCSVHVVGYSSWYLICSGTPKKIESNDSERIVLIERDRQTDKE